MTSPLTIMDIREGVVGPTGTVWTILPDCHFTVARQIGIDATGAAKITEPFKTGQLAPEQQLQLKELLAHTAIARLPATLGVEQQVNARRITLSYQGTSAVLSLPPGDPGTLSAAAPEDPAARMINLANAVKKMTGG